jgi:hypothetical protein
MRANPEKSCCGLDVYKSMVMACIAHGPLDKPPIFEIRKFSTMTNLERLSVIAEIGVDMSRFPDEAHISSWAEVVSRKQRERRKEEERQDAKRQ